MAKIDNSAEILDWLKAAMAHARMSQADLARLIWNNDRSVPNKILLGKRKVQIPELAAIQRVTGYRPFETEPDSDMPARVELPPRPSRKFHVKEWRVHSEWTAEDVAQAIGMDATDYKFRELNPHKFTIEEMEAVAGALKIGFDQLRFLPPKAKVAVVASVKKPRSARSRS